MNQTRIRELRKTKGWTQERLAENSGVAVRTIQRLESGEDASLETLALLADALNVDVSDLFTSVDRADTADAIKRLDVIRAEQKRQAEERLQKQRNNRLIRRTVLVAVAVIVVLVVGLMLSPWIYGALAATGAGTTNGPMGGIVS
ncbi:helix-turn-helix domain-containing protein [Leifsonia sp. Le1]|uniref:helix-turn-helix domain-containing protein n=1 Tax=Leifsonia sp. Le1 TaxID=3404918 RepID=UPI003EBA1F98